MKGVETSGITGGQYHESQMSQAPPGVKGKEKGAAKGPPLSRST